MRTTSLRTHYNHIAGQNVERLAALSDGVFAVAMTLLVLDLRTPAETAVHSESDLWKAIVLLAPRVLVYLMSFLTLGIFWVGQQTQLNYFSHSDRHLTWIHLAFLFGVSLMPFSTSLMAAFISYRLALLLYWANIFALGVILFAAWRYGKSSQLVKRDLSAELADAIERRIIIAQALYALGALLCLVNTYWSLGFILLVQINYAIAPRFNPLSRL
ncbi:MAG: TMEM175 family protein [Methylovirgula sp.]